MFRIQVLLLSVAALFGLTAILAIIFNERRKVLAEREEKSRRTEVCESLGNLIGKGSELLENMRYRKAHESEPEVDEWMRAVADYVELRLGKSYVIRLRNLIDIPAVFADGFNPRQKQLWDNVRARVIKLERFSQELCKKPKNK